MRVLPLLVTTLLLAAPVFAQQTAVPQHAKAAAPSEAVAQTVGQPPLHPITPHQVHEILELTGANKLKEQMMRSMWGSLQKSFPPFFPKDVLDDLEANMLKIDFEPMAVKAYQKRISAEDAELIIAFDKTQAGKRLIAAAPLIQQEMLMGGYKAGVQVAQEVIARHADEIKAAAAKYKQEHSDTPQVTSPN
jgi:hypothetical protein